MQFLGMLFLGLMNNMLASVVDVTLHEHGFSLSPGEKLQLFPNDMIVFYFSSSKPLSITEMDPGTCSPKSGGHSFAPAPASSSLFIDFDNVGDYEFSTLEDCSLSDSSKRLKVSVEEIPKNPYHFQVEKLLNQIKLEEKLIELKKSSAFRSFGLASTLLILLAISLAIL